MVQIQYGPPFRRPSLAVLAGVLGLGIRCPGQAEADEGVATGRGLIAADGDPRELKAIAIVAAPLDAAGASGRAFWIRRWA